MTTLKAATKMVNAVALEEMVHGSILRRAASIGSFEPPPCPLPPPTPAVAVAATAHSSPGGFDALVFATSPLRDIASAGLATPTSRAGGKVDFSPVFDFGGGGSAYSSPAVQKMPLI